MKYWLLKTEPTEYSFADLQAERRAVWDGVKNNWALQFLRAMSTGDPTFIYHTGKDKHIAGIAEVVRAHYPDPALDDEKRAVIDIRAVRALPEPVKLATIKADATFATFHLVSMSRLSVMPVKAAWWKKLCALGGCSTDFDRTFV